MITPPTSDEPHTYQCISYTAEAFIDVSLRYGVEAVPRMREALNAPAAVGDEGMMLWGGSAEKPQAAEEEEED